jgi:hypothetical protein
VSKRYIVALSSPDHKFVRFLEHPKVWTPSVVRAKKFKSRATAIRYCDVHTVRDYAVKLFSNLGVYLVDQTAEGRVTIGKKVHPTSVVEQLGEL